MILISGSQRERLARAILCHEFLNGIGGPNVKEAEERHHSKPMGRCIHVTSTIVSMESKHATHDEAPLDGLIGHLESEKRL